ncbi:MAG TPA: DUF547 domain-containing protein [Malonomonas sp.]
MGFPIRAMLFTTLLLSIGSTTLAAPKAELWSRWQANDPHSTLSIDHSLWGEFLERYLVTAKPGATNLVRYTAVSAADKSSLADYLAVLSATPMTKLNRAEQKAAWINLYNALTVHTILEHYPLQSIREISSGWFSRGPWDQKLIRVEGVELSLNDIEHRILRPIWQDNRVHYAVNCASLGCPNLQPEPFSTENSDRLLTAAAREFINSPRGAMFNNGKLQLSSIYDWFQVDFGNSSAGVIAHLKQYASPDLKEKLHNYSGSINYDYNWNLNIKQAD